MPIAAIRFLDSEPTNTIQLRLDNAHALLRQEWPESRDQPRGMVPFRDVRLGRMLGRAIAHEIGHFLSRSGEHTRNGLMRASHSVAALTGASLAPFHVKENPRRTLYATRAPAEVDESVAVPLMPR